MFTLLIILYNQEKNTQNQLTYKSVVSTNFD